MLILIYLKRSEICPSLVRLRRNPPAADESVDKLKIYISVKSMDFLLF